jgi:hypothetical protein
MVKKYHSGKCDCELCKTYTEAHLEGYDIGLKDGLNIQYKSKIWAEAFLIGSLTGMGFLTIILIYVKWVGVI